VRSKTIVHLSGRAQISWYGPARRYPQPMLRVLPRRPRVLIFDVVRLSAPVPWLSGRASASHAEGRWFDPSRDHRGITSSQGLFAFWRGGSMFRMPGYPPFIRSHGHVCMRFRFMLDIRGPVAALRFRDAVPVSARRQCWYVPYTVVRALWRTCGPSRPLRKCSCAAGLCCRGRKMSTSAELSAAR
jgi:hypothetical protein